MNRLLSTIEKISATQTEIRELESAIERFPNEQSLVLNLRSVERRYEELEAEFREVSHQQFLDICSYTVFSEEDQQRYTIPALANALADFQSLFTNVYDAIKNGPRQRQTRSNLEANINSTFEFGYSFSGSVGFMLTLPNDRLLIGDTDLDKAMDTIFNMAKAQDPEQILIYARELGAAPIRAMYKWVSDHENFGLGADINWSREHEVKYQLTAQVPEFQKVRQAIDSSSDETVSDIDVKGELLGADAATKTFHFKTEDGIEIRGRMELNIDEQNFVSLPRRYKASIRQVSIISYSTEEEKTSHYLLSLEN
ncbi:MAG: hypothetical protein ACR2N0_09310 [Rubrobacteraceae bacterium]|jgi:hypothetical protein